MSLWSVRIVLTRFYNSSSTQVPRFLSSPLLLLRSNSVRNNLLPTTRTSRFHSIYRCCHSVCVDSRRDSTHTENSAIDSVLDSVVKIFCSCSEPDVAKPWKNSWEGLATGSGFAIFGRRILTNAHVVEDHSYLQVKKHGSPTKYRAIVEAVGDECDLAILAVDNEEFWEDLNPLELGDIPSIGETIFAVGYPCGGVTISVTKGIVSRVEVDDYCHSSTELLTIQIDATVRCGNSGGPVIRGNKVVVVFQGKERINFNHLVSMKKPGEIGLFKVLRDGREHEFKISLNSVQQRLVPVRNFDPNCYVFAGFIFVPLSKQNTENSYGAICDCTLKRRPQKPVHEIIIISQVLWDTVNIGYSSFKNLQV
ncbi:putative peptidase Do [Arabidopsis thaliana]